MTTHYCIDRKKFGIATEVRRWFRTAKTVFNYEISLGWRYATIAASLFGEERLAAAHVAFPGLWLSISFQSDWNWAKRLSRWFRAKYKSGIECGAAYFDSNFTISILGETDFDDQRPKRWWKRMNWRMPWHRVWIRTEILDFSTNSVVWVDKHRDGRSFTDKWEAEKAAKESVSRKHAYAYRLKNGDVQNRIATFYVDRMYWGFLWMPLPLIKRTCISVTFNEEVGERTGSWKGGTTGCGYQMRANETPLETLLRMERERVFK